MKKATNNNFKKVGVNAIIERYEMDSARNVKNAPTNNAIIEMLENTSLEYLQVETSRSGSIFINSLLPKLILLTENKGNIFFEL
jgi:hypothetical protein